MPEKHGITSPKTEKENKMDYYDCVEFPQTARAFVGDPSVGCPPEITDFEDIQRFCCYLEAQLNRLKKSQIKDRDGKIVTQLEFENYMDAYYREEQNEKMHNGKPESNRHLKITRIQFMDNLTIIS